MKVEVRHISSVSVQHNAYEVEFTDTLDFIGSHTFITYAGDEMTALRYAQEQYEIEVVKKYSHHF